MSNSTTIREKAQSPKHRKLSALPDDRSHTHNSQPILTSNIKGWTHIGGIIHQVLWEAVHETPLHKRAEAIEALAERGIFLTAGNAHTSLAGARA